MAAARGASQKRPEEPHECGVRARTELGSSMSAFQKVPFAIRDGVHLASAGGDRVCTRGNACARLSHTFGVLRGQLMATI